MLTRLICILTAGVCAALLSAAPALAENAYIVSRTTYPAQIKGNVETATTIIEDGEDTVTCSKTEVSGEIKESVQSVKIVPKYGECIALIAGSKVAATVAMGNCGYELGQLGEANEVVKGSVSIGSKGCGPVVIKTSLCNFELSPQGPDSGITVSENKSEELEASGKVKASIASKCPGTKESIPPIALFLVAHLGLHITIEALTGSFIFTPNIINIARNTAQGVIVKNNQFIAPLIFAEDEIFNAQGWAVETNNCVGFYRPGASCEVKLKAPNAATTGAIYRVKGWILSRGSVNLTST